MNHNDFDALIIGAGSGGLTVAVGLTGLGKRVALIEKGNVGGDCTNTGCIPSKTLLAAVREPSLASPADMLAHVRSKRDHLVGEENTWVEGIENLSFIRGQATFLAGNVVEVSLHDGQRRTLRAPHVIIASGSSAVRIPIAGLPVERTLTNDNLFELTEAPRHLAIVGAGVIGVEMAFAFAGLASQVSLIDLAPRVLSTASERASSVVEHSLATKGVNIYLSCKVESYSEADGSLHLSDGSTITKVDKVLLAMGRRPNVDNMGLENIGLRFDKRGIPTNAYAQTNIKGLYAIGDVTPQSNFTHSANAQGRRLVQRIAFPFLPALSPEPEYPSAVFSQPEVAQIGPKRADLHKRYHPQLITSFSYELSKTDKGYTEGIESGYITLHAMRFTGRLLSAEIVAPAASEMISLLSLAINKRVSLYSLSQLVFPYPTLSEAVKKAADAFSFSSLAKLPQECFSYLRHRPVVWLMRVKHRLQALSSI